MVQGGDPTGTGDGGESIYGRPFKDEFHSRIKFNHRGLIACANQNAPNTNGAQFFITLDRADHLDRKATIFGKITGDTVYNLMKFNELETKEDDRPVDPPVLLRAEVLLNPFDDIKPRVSREAKEAAKAEEAKKKEAEKKNTRKGAKNFKLISFGDEAEEEEAAEVEAAATMKIKSAHDLLEDEKLSKEAAVEVDLAKVREAMKAAKGGRSASAREVEALGDDDTKDWAAKIREKVASRMNKPGSTIEEQEDYTEEGAIKERKSGDEDNEEGALIFSGKTLLPPSKRARLEGTGPGTKSKAAIVAPSRQIQIQDKDLLTTWEQRRQTYKERKRLAGHREKDTMSKLATFMQKISSSKPKIPENTTGGENSTRSKEENEQEKGGAGEHINGGDIKNQKLEGGKGYDGKVDENIDHRAYMPAAWRLDTYLGGNTSKIAGESNKESADQDNDDDDFSLDTLRNHKLEFGGKKEKDPHARRDNVDDYVVVDPLLEAGKAKFNKQQQRTKKRDREWAGRSRD
jgi:peptidyl-prolyl cis-trans isomerase SDCCAG10